MKIIGLVSGKGGVGKTTTIANLGAALSSEFKRSALVVDGNFTTPDLGLHLGIYSFPNTLQDALKNKIPASEAIYIHSSGVSIISASSSTGGAKKTKISSKKLKETLKSLNKYEWILIDSPPWNGKRCRLGPKCLR